MPRAAALAVASARAGLAAACHDASPPVEAALSPLWSLLHPPDAEGTAKPIVMNGAIEKPEAAGAYEPRALPFKPLAPAELLRLPIAELEPFLAALYRSIDGRTTLGEKANTLLYFEALALDGQVATMIVNSAALVALFSRLLRTAAASALRVRVATLLGLLLRHASYVGVAVATGGDLMQTLERVVTDRHETVRRRCVAALGELLFYASPGSSRRSTTTRAERRPRGGGKDGGGDKDGGDGDAPAAPPTASAAPDDGEWAQAWPPAAVCDALLHAASGVAADSVSAHYACKTYENVCIGALRGGRHHPGRAGGRGGAQSPRHGRGGRPGLRGERGAADDRGDRRVAAPPHPASVGQGALREQRPLLALLPSHATRRRASPCH